MNIKRFVRTLIIATLLLINVGCDQISKIAVRKSLHDYEIVEVSSYLTLRRVENSGAFLSLGDTLPHVFKIVLLLILPSAVLISGVIFLILKTNISKTILTGSCFVIGGGIGNIYDRIVYGSVTDFLHIDLIIFQTGIFNMADVSIMTGMFIILISAFIKEKDPAVENLL